MVYSEAYSPPYKSQSPRPHAVTIASSVSVASDEAPPSPTEEKVSRIGTNDRADRNLSSYMATVASGVAPSHVEAEASSTEPAVQLFTTPSDVTKLASDALAVATRFARERKVACDDFSEAQRNLVAKLTDLKSRIDGGDDACTLIEEALGHVNHSSTVDEVGTTLFANAFDLDEEDAGEFLANDANTNDIERELCSSLGSLALTRSS